MQEVGQALGLTPKEFAKSTNLPMFNHESNYKDVDSEQFKTKI